MELIKNKRVGKVLLIVEGGKHEFNLFKKIFSEVLGFTQIEKRRGNTNYFIREGDRHSVIAVINTKTSNIASINECDYLDAIFEKLIEQYNFDINNAAIYYLFDRDPESNVNIELIYELIHTLKNSRENEDSMQGGMLILSYPAIEAYEISSFINESYKMQEKLGRDLKQYINNNASIIAMNKISGESIVHAAKELEKYLEEQGISLYLDNFTDTSEAVFRRQEKCFKEYNKFNVLSMLSCVLMDLGILVK